MNVILPIALVLHGLIHLFGFAKAFNLAPVNQLSQPIPKAAGVFWLITTSLFILAASLLFMEKAYWWMLAVPAILFSQNLIFTTWSDAKFGTILNVILLVGTLVGYGTWSFARAYKNEVATNLREAISKPDSLLTEKDLLHLPEPVKQYIRYTGAVGQPKVNNFKIEFTGQIRKDEASEWMQFESEQYNFLNSSTRLFFMNATMNHLPVAGFHAFKNGTAFMDIRLLSLIKVQYQSGKEMGIAETVTFFNDMCCMAPATLIDQRIKWIESDSTKVKAEFSNNGISITADLYFNERGELINFVSEDRYAAGKANTMKKIRWSTPLKDYKEINGHRLAGYAQAVYSYPSGDLCYGIFNLKNVIYNSNNKELTKNSISAKK